MYSTTTYLYKKSTALRRTASQKRQNVPNSLTATQLNRQNTPGPPRVQPRDLCLGMQTQSLRCDWASVQRKSMETI